MRRSRRLASASVVLGCILFAKGFGLAFLFAILPSMAPPASDSLAVQLILVFAAFPYATSLPCVTGACFVAGGAMILRRDPHERGRPRSQARTASPWAAVIGSVVALLVLVAHELHSHAEESSRATRRRTMTRLNAQALRAAADTWRADRPIDECPTPDGLRRDHVIDAAMLLTDAWGNPFVITCTPDATRVSSDATGW